MTGAKITNRDFLLALYGDTLIGHGWVTSYDAVKPKDADGRHWGGRKYLFGDELKLSSKKNNYFSVAALDGDSRTKDDFVRLLCIVLDDPDITALKLSPSWVTETSPGKYQAGYILADEPDTYDVERCSRAIKALADHGLIKKDTSGNNAVRYCRLPVGSNNGYDKLFAHALREWAPDLRYAISDVLTAYLPAAVKVPTDPSEPKTLPTDPVEGFSPLDDLMGGDRLDYSQAAQQIASGESLHDPSMRMLASLAHYGVPDAQILGMVEGMILASGADPERVKARIKDLPRMLEQWKRKHPPQPADPERFKPLTMAELLRQPPMQWIIKGVIPRAEIVCIFGEPGCGKSFLIFDMGAAIDRGIDWRGQKTRKGRVWIVVAEGVAGMRNRAHAHCIENGGEELGIKFICDQPNLFADRDHPAIASQIEAAGGADVIVIDTLAAVAVGAKENSDDMNTVIAHCKKLHRLTGAVIVLIAHSGKDPTKGVRGWSGTKAAIDAEIEVTRSGDARGARITKQKDGTDGAEFPFRLRVVEIGIDEDGLPITSCVVDHGIEMPSKTGKRGPRGSIQKLVMQVLADLEPLDGGKVNTEKLITESVNRLPPTELGKRDNRRGSAIRAIRELQNDDLLKVEGESVCAT